MKIYNLVGVAIDGRDGCRSVPECGETGSLPAFHIWNEPYHLGSKMRLSIVFEPFWNIDDISRQRQRPYLF
jgi:hypothetical protein